jgi:hypothetical protein
VRRGLATFFVIGLLDGHMRAVRGQAVAINLLSTIMSGVGLRVEYNARLVQRVLELANEFSAPPALASAAVVGSAPGHGSIRERRTWWNPTQWTPVSWPFQRDSAVRIPPIPPHGRCGRNQRERARLCDVCTCGRLLRTAAYALMLELVETFSGGLDVVQDEARAAAEPLFLRK